MKSRKLIEQLFKTGKSFSVFPFRVYYVYAEKVFNAPETVFPVQFGVGVGTKNFKRAVDRNRIKRLTREAYRLQKIPLCALVKEKKRQLAVFFLYTGKELPEYNMLSEKLALTLERLMKVIS